ncbi:MAG: hypothetical protein LBV00_09335 [Propionibacteriaceae bacterium]|jgi:UDP-N-acetylmuramyl tripeptide synthase|nr:hypothetical protein [Propionibacteriaceae bacterium]
MTRHRLSEYASALGLARPTRGDDPVITQVTYDSREVQPGALFICKGVHFKPAFLAEAIKRGAVAYLSEKPYESVIGAKGLPCLLVGDMRAAIATTGTLFYGCEWDRLTLLGITGTKGKSTSTIFLQSILAAWMRRVGGPRPGILSSIRYEDGVSTTASIKTTPETLDLYGHLHNAVAQGLRYMCVEVSSQGLRYRRVANLSFEVGCFLNISEDHISPQEHKDFEDYLSAKLMIFDQSRLAVVNAHTQQVDRVMAAAGQCERVVTFAARHQGACDAVVGGSASGGVGSGGAVGGSEAGGSDGVIGDSAPGGSVGGAGSVGDSGSGGSVGSDAVVGDPASGGVAGSGQGPINHRWCGQADVVGTDVVSTDAGQEFTVAYDGHVYRCAIGMPGAFNVDNALAAISMAWLLGVPDEDIRTGLASAHVPGRMEVFRLNRGTTVIVDYAHQKLSLTTLLETVAQEYPQSHLTMVFGASGNKGLNRHQELGMLAGRNADEIYLTEDDPGDVPVLEIAREVDGYVQATGHGPAHLVADRPEAIREAVAAAPDDGVVLVIGKGAEKWQLRGGVNVEVVSDIDTVRAILDAGD